MLSNSSISIFDANGARLTDLGGFEKCSHAWHEVSVSN